MSATLLVVEDTPLNLKLFRVLLRSAGYEVLEAETGRRALEVLRDVVPDLIIMDLQLPEIDGIEVIETFRADPRMAQVPVIVVSGYAMKRDEDDALRAGADRFLPKPVDNRLLLDSVAELLRSGRRT